MTTTMTKQIAPKLVSVIIDGGEFDHYGIVLTEIRGYTLFEIRVATIHINRPPLQTGFPAMMGEVIPAQIRLTLIAFGSPFDAQRNHDFCRTDFRGLCRACRRATRASIR